MVESQRAWGAVRVTIERLITPGDFRATQMQEQQLLWPALPPPPPAQVYGHPGRQPPPRPTGLQPVEMGCQHGQHRLRAGVQQHDRVVGGIHVQAVLWGKVGNVRPKPAQAGGGGSGRRLGQGRRHCRQAAARRTRQAHADTFAHISELQEAHQLGEGGSKTSGGGIMKDSFICRPAALCTWDGDQQTAASRQQRYFGQAAPHRSILSTTLPAFDFRPARHAI